MREISLDVSDIAQNSIDAGAKLLQITIAITNGVISFEVTDDGEGMDESTLAVAMQRGVSFKGSTGLGLAIVAEDAHKANGKFEITSQKGCGTRVTASFLRACDGVTLGDLGATAVTLVDEGYDTVLTLIIGENKFEMDTRKLKSASSVAELQSHGVLRLIREDINKFIRQNGGAIL